MKPKLHQKETIYNVGDLVFDARYGWGEVTLIDWRHFDPVEVKFFENQNKAYYRPDGKDTAFNTKKSLLLEEDLLKIIQTKPVKTTTSK